MPIDPVFAALLRHSVRPTAVRRAVLDILFQSPFALSGAEIEQQLPLDSDRITLYRTLRTFEAKGLAHRVIDHSETVRYAVYREAPPATDAAANHVHFKCLACQRTYCLSQVMLPTVVVPAHYQAVRGDYLISGICEWCQPE